MSEEKNKGGRPLGWRKEDSKRGFLALRCALGEKTKWVKTAQRQGKKLGEWVIETLNRAASKNPE